VKAALGWTAFAVVIYGLLYGLLGTEWGFLRSEIALYRVQCCGPEPRVIPVRTPREIVAEILRESPQMTEEKVVAEAKRRRKLQGQGPEPRPFTLSRRTFKVFTGEQRVVAWYDDGPVVKLDQCAVRDRVNWSCDMPGGGKLGFKDGEYFDSASLGQPDLAALHSVSGFQWSQLRLGLYYGDERGRPRPVLSWGVAPWATAAK
jgi:hypothetical protein